MSYSNQNIKLDPGQFESYCPGFIAYVNNNYNKKDKSMTKNQFCEQNIKSFCASTDPTISVDNCDDLFNDNQHHQPDSMSVYCDCKKKFTNPSDILSCCIQQTGDQYDCQDDVNNNTPCGPVTDGYQPYCDCRQQIAKNDPDIFKYGNAIISCCTQKSNNPSDCTLYVESKRDCPGQPNTPPSQPDKPPSQPNTPPSKPDTPPAPYTPPSPYDPPSQPSKPSSGKVGSKNNILESLTVPEKIGFFMAIIVVCILIYFIIELSKKK
jgi:hypothetical protein